MDLLRTSALVTAFSAAEHCLGFLYRILLSRTLGAEGLGRYQMALTVFSVLLMLSASGLPATLSRTVAAHRTRGDKRAERSAVTAALLLSFCVSLFFEALLFALRPLFAGVFSDEGAERLFYILLLGLPPTAVYAVLRGYFWGEKRFFLYSFTELSEEAVMIAAGSCLLVFCPLALAKETLAAGAVLLSRLFSFSLAFGCFLARGGAFASPKRAIKPLLASALPLTAMRAASSLTGMLVSFLFPLCLTAAGATSQEAMAEYGVVYGMVMPVMLIPSAFLSSAALVLVPEFSECAARGEKEKLASLTKKAVSAALLIAGALLPLYAVLGRDIGILLFDSPESGVLIAFGSLLLLPMSVSMIAGSLLNSLRCEKHTLFIFLAGAGAMILCVVCLAGKLGSGALLCGMAAEHTLSAVLSLAVLKRKTGTAGEKKLLFKVLASSCIAIAFGLVLRKFFLLHLSFLPALVCLFVFLPIGEAVLFALFGLADLRALLRRLSPPRDRAAKAENTRKILPSRGIFSGVLLTRRKK